MAHGRTVARDARVRNKYPGGSHSLEAGSFALILPGEEHQFENDGNTTFKFLCIIPKHGQ